MIKEKTDKLMNLLMGLSSLAVLGGALLKIWHHPMGSSILWLGIIAYSILSSIEISRLKRIIAESKRVVNPDELAV